MSYSQEFIGWQVRPDSIREGRCLLAKSFHLFVKELSHK
jgi:hypothetical protein